MLAQLCAGSSLKRLPWQPPSAALPNVEASTMVVAGGDGGLKRSSLHSLRDAAAFCFAGDEEGSSPFLSPHPPPRTLLDTGSFLYLCRVASTPGSYRTLVRIWRCSLHGQIFFERDQQISGQPGKKAFSSAK